MSNVEVVRAIDLIKGQQYPIIHIENIVGSYGPQTVIYLENNKMVYLPKRMFKTEEEISSLVCKQLSIVRTGEYFVEKYNTYTALLEIVKSGGMW